MAHAANGSTRKSSSRRNIALLRPTPPDCKSAGCARALQWLDAHGIEYRSVDIVTSPPSRSELERARVAAGVPVKKLFNVSGESYRAGGWKDKLATTSDAAAVAALAADGKLIKRPLVVGDRVALIGFDADAWAAALA